MSAPASVRRSGERVPALDCAAFLAPLTTASSAVDAPLATALSAVGALLSPPPSPPPVLPSRLSVRRRGLRSELSRYDEGSPALSPLAAPDHVTAAAAAHVDYDVRATHFDDARALPVGQAKAELKKSRNAIAKLCLDARMKSMNGRIPKGMVKGLVAQRNREVMGLGLTESMVYSLVKNMSAKAATTPVTITKPDNRAVAALGHADAVSAVAFNEQGGTTENPPTKAEKERRKPGRPKHTSLKEIQEKKVTRQKLLNDITAEYAEMRARRAPRRLSKGEFDLLVARMKQERGIGKDDGYFAFAKTAIDMRIQRGRLMAFGKGPIPPTQALEEALVEALLPRRGQTVRISTRDGVALANKVKKMVDASIRHAMFCQRRVPR